MSKLIVILITNIIKCQNYSVMNNLLHIFVIRSSDKYFVFIEQVDKLIGFLHAYLDVVGRIYTSKTTCCKRSGNFCTIVTGCPEVKDTPYIGAVVLYRVLHSRDGVLAHSDAGDVFTALPKMQTNVNE